MDRMFMTKKFADMLQIYMTLKEIAKCDLKFQNVRLEFV